MMRSPTPYQSWLAFAEAHSADFMVPCECEKRFYHACGCIHGTCPWCNDTFHRPKELGELLAMLEETGVRDITFAWNPVVIPAGANKPGGWEAYAFTIGEVSSVSPTREEACARLWLAVAGRKV
jgi:hypothetical protein